MLRLAAVLAVLALGALLKPASAIKELSGWNQGLITHYGGKQDGMDPSSPSLGTKEGACGYGSIPKDHWPYFSVAALSPQNQFLKSGPLDGCGQCFQIQCESGIDGQDSCIKDSRGKPKSILVMISDKCPECEADHIDVQSLAFAKLVNPGIGRIKVTYRRIECTPPEDIKVSIMDFVGSNGWLRLSIEDTGGRGAVKSLHVKGSSSGSWLPMTNSWGATWELGSAPGPPLDFQIETDNGEKVVAGGVVKVVGGISNGNSMSFATGVQFSISDPAVMQVKAASGPSDSQDPMVATSDTPGNGGGNGAPTLSLSGSSGNISSNSSSSGSSGGSAACVDMPAPGSFSCAQQKEWGKCSDPFLVSQNYCALTCRRCTSGGAGNSTAGEPKVQSSSGPGGRKMLMQPTNT